MSTRDTRAANRRKTWHGTRVAQARTRRAAFHAACDWLITEAISADRIEDAIDAVLATTHEIRKEASHGDRHGQ